MDVPKLGIPGLGATPAVTHQQMVGRLEYVRPNEMLRQQEQVLETPTHDQVEVRARVEAAPTETPPPPQPSTAEQPAALTLEMQRAREKFEPGLQSSGASLLQNNADGWLTPHHGLSRGSIPDMLADTTAGTWSPTPPDRGGPSFLQRILGPQRGGFGRVAKIMMGVALGGALLTAVAAPLMCMSPMMVPMMSMLSLNMMMMPLMMGGMGGFPGMGFPGMGFPGMGFPGGVPMPPQMPPPPWNPPPPNADPNAGQPAPPPPRTWMTAPLANDGPPQSSLVAAARVLPTPPQQAALAAMSADRQQAFQSLFNRYDGQSVQLSHRNEQINVNAQLLRLLEEGKLNAQDKDGNDLLHNLTVMATQPTAPGVDGRLLAAQAVVQLADPAHTMTQGNHGTCAAHTVEYMLARKNPAEYMRIANGLASAEGKVALVGRETAQRIDDAIPEDGSGRTALNRMMQSAFMNVGGGSWGRRYSNRVDNFVPTDWGAVLDPRGAANEPGLVPEQVQHLAGAVLGEKYAEIYREGQDPRPALQLIDRVTSQDREPVPVSLELDQGRHRILVNGIHDGRVYFHNPMGQRSVNARAPWTASHVVGDDGNESMSIADFQSRMRSAIVPQRVLGGV